MWFFAQWWSRKESSIFLSPILFSFYSSLLPHLDPSQRRGLDLFTRGGRTQNRDLICDWARYDVSNYDVEGFGHVPMALNIAFNDGSVRFKHDPDLVVKAPNTVNYSVSMFWDSGYLEQ